MNSIAALISFDTDESIFIERRIGSTQDTETTAGTYNGTTWGWAPGGGYPIVIGAMYKVTIVRAAGYDYGDLTLTGCFEPFEFDLYDLSGDDDNDNWISLPWNKGYLTTTVDIGESIGAAFTPEEGDTLTIAVWDVANQNELTTVGTYSEEVWSWYGENDVWPGMPFIVRPYRSGGMPTITWP